MRIEKYTKDKVITANDFVIGTDGDKQNKTQNFRIWQLSQIILGQLKNSGLVLQFANSSNPEVIKGTEGYFFTNDDTISKNQVHTFYLSETTLFGENLSALLNSVGANLGDLYVNLTQVDDAGNYGFFNILSLERIGKYYKVEATARGTLFAKTFKPWKNYALTFDLATNEWSISAEGGTITIYKNGVPVDEATIDFDADSLNLARLVKGTVDDNGIATFIRDDETTFTVDFSGFLGAAIPKKTSDLINNGEGDGDPFVTDAYNKNTVDNKDAFIQEQVSLNTQDIEWLKGLDISIDETRKKIQLINFDKEVFAEADVTFLDDEGVRLEYNKDAKSIELYNSDDELLDSIPARTFLDGLGVNIRLNDIDENKLELIGSGGDVIGVVDFYIKNIEGLQKELDSKEPKFDKNTGFNKDFGNTAGTVVEGNDQRIENGQTAYSWGNHALAGYLKSVVVLDSNDNPNKHEIGVVDGKPLSETVTALNKPTLLNNILTLKFLNESNIEQTIDVDLTGLVTNSSGINNATYNAASNIITLTEIDGDVWNIDLSEFSILTSTDATGVTTLTQEGVTKLTTSRAGQTGQYAHLLGLPNLDIYATKTEVDSEIARIEANNDVIGKPIYVPTNELSAIDRSGVVQWLNENGFSKLDKEFIVVDVYYWVSNGYVKRGYVTLGYVSI